MQTCTGRPAGAADVRGRRRGSQSLGCVTHLIFTAAQCRMNSGLAEQQRTTDPLVMHLTFARVLALARRIATP